MGVVPRSCREPPCSDYWKLLRLIPVLQLFGHHYAHWGIFIPTKSCFHVFFSMTIVTPTPKKDVLFKSQRKRKTGRMNINVNKKCLKQACPSSGISKCLFKKCISLLTAKMGKFCISFETPFLGV